MERLNDKECKKCGSNDQVVITEDIVKKTGILRALIYIGLLMIPVLGWIVLFIAIVKRPRTERVTSSVCQSCGNKEILSVV